MEPVIQPPPPAARSDVLPRRRWIPVAARTRIAFLIPSLVAHGAERQLCELVRGLDRTRFEVHVLVFYGPEDQPGASLWAEATSIPGSAWHCLHKRHGPTGHLDLFPRLLSLLRRIQPDLLHGYMDANLHALLAGRLLGRPVVWGIRRASRDLSTLDRLSRGLLRVHAGLSRFADLAIFNSEAGRASYREMGFRTPRMLVIPNGFDVARFVPDPDRGRAQRRAWGIPADIPLVGMVGRLDPVKDHPTFLRAAARLGGAFESVRFVCVGDGSRARFDALRGLAANLGLTDRLLWTGPCADMAAAYNAMSLLILTSRDEGFPNVLGEAMACGVPCVATRVGDAARLLGDTGLLADPGDDAALAEAAARLLFEPLEARRARGQACRARVCSAFDVRVLAQRTEQAFLTLLSASPESVSRAEA